MSGHGKQGIWGRVKKTLFGIESVSGLNPVGVINRTIEKIERNKQIRKMEKARRELENDKAYQNLIRVHEDPVLADFFNVNRVVLTKAIANLEKGIKIIEGGGDVNFSIKDPRALNSFKGVIEAILLLRGERERLIRERERVAINHDEHALHEFRHDYHEFLKNFNKFRRTIQQPKKQLLLELIEEAQITPQQGKK